MLDQTGSKLARVCDSLAFIQKKQRSRLLFEFEHMRSQYTTVSMIQLLISLYSVHVWTLYGDGAWCVLTFSCQKLVRDGGTVVYNSYYTTALVKSTAPIVLAKKGIVPLECA